MHAKRSFLRLLICLAALTAVSAAQSAAPGAAAAPPQSPSASTLSAAQTPPPLRVRTRLVTVDVVATNSHGVVRDLKAEDFQISDGGPQKIEKFAFIDHSANAAANGPAPARGMQPSGIYSNQVALTGLSMPPTVVLIDALNTEGPDLISTRRDMLSLLQKLPSDTPIAVFALGHSLSVLQSFTSDPAVLKAAVTKALKAGAPLSALPGNDQHSLSLAAFDANQGQESDSIQALEDVERRQYADDMDVRVMTTLDALKTIAKYLHAYQGRKNLVWVSGSFPTVLWPDPDLGTRYAQFRDSRDYQKEMQAAAHALDDAQISVYPVDARGLQVIQVMTASQRPVLRGAAAGRTMGAQISRESQARMQTQLTMNTLAEDTGGRACENTNDLSGCAQAALRDSSSYYELAYVPQDTKWDGSFHKISVKTRRSGTNLAYRRGYFAQDAQQLASQQTTNELLRDACREFLPSTAIAMTAQLMPPDRADRSRYLVSISQGENGLGAEGQPAKLTATMATCAYDADSKSFKFLTTDVSETFSDAAYQSFEANGVRKYVEVPTAGTSRVRVAVVDMASGLVGALDIPAQANVAAPDVPSPSVTARHESTSPSAPNPALNNASSDTSISFQGSLAQASKLDWGGDALAFKGELGVEKAAPAFFSQFFHAQGMHCEAGNLVASDGNSPDSRLQLTFSNGRAQATVDLRSEHPEYSGTLQVDATAKAFFDRLWYLVHCRAAPVSSQ